MIVLKTKETVEEAIERWTIWTVGLSLLLPIFIQIGVTILGGDPFTLPSMVFVLMLGGMVAFLVFVWLRPHRPTSLPKGKVFPGPVSEQRVNWERTQLSESLRENIKAKQSGITVVSGPSGAGKSILVRDQVVKLLEAEETPWSIMLIDSYDELKDIQDLVAKGLKTHDIHHLLILDQFEQVALQSSEYRQRFVEFLDEQINKGIRCLIIVREDFFFRLRFLNREPSPSQSVAVFGIDDNEPKVLRAVIRDLRLVAEEECVKDILLDLKRPSTLGLERGISPLDLQIVGLMLEVESRDVGLIDPGTYTRDLQGRDGIYRKYFATLIKATQYPRTAHAVLFALSVQHPIRRPLTKSEIARATFQPDHQVGHVLKFFSHRNLGLIRQLGDGYQWAHDQLAAAYRDYSAEMSGGFRDAVTLMVERNHRGVLSKMNVLDFRDNMTASLRHSWAMMMFFLLIGSSVRMLLAAFGVNLDFVGLYQSSTMPQTAYISIGITHMLWALYVYRLCSNFLGRVKPEIRLMSWQFVAVIGFFSVVTTWLMPELWLVAIGTMALILGIDRWAIGLRANLTRPASHELIREGRITAFNGIVVMIAGVIYTLIVVLPLQSWKAWQYFEPIVHWSTYGLAVLLSGIALMMIDYHTSPDALDVLLSHVERQRTVYVVHGQNS